MLKKLIMIGLLGISLTTILAAEANAQISGWAGFGFSNFTFEVDLKRVKNPTKLPSLLVVDGTLNSIECFCLNPRNLDVFPGRPAVQEVSADKKIPGELPKPGQVTVTFLFPLDGYGDLACNKNWVLVRSSDPPYDSSCAADNITLVMHWYRCNGDSTIDPCFDANLQPTVDKSAPIDEAATECTLDPVRRDANHIPEHGQEFDCPEIPLP